MVKYFYFHLFSHFIMCNMHIIKCAYCTFYYVHIAHNKMCNMHILLCAYCTYLQYLLFVFVRFEPQILSGTLRFHPRPDSLHHGPIPGPDSFHHGSRPRSDSFHKNNSHGLPYHRPQLLLFMVPPSSGTMPIYTLHLHSSCHTIWLI